MADVLSTLPVVVASDLHMLDIDLEAVGQNLRHLHGKALAHLGAAVVQVDRAVLVDMDEGAGLVQRAVSVKEMPNFTGVSAMPFLI